MNFRAYLKQAAWMALLSSLALGLVCALVLAVIGDTSFKLSADISFGRLDGLWLLLLAPVAGVLLTVLLSPLSYTLHRLLVRRHR